MLMSLPRITDSTDYSYRHVISLTNDTDTFIVSLQIIICYQIIII